MTDSDEGLQTLLIHIDDDGDTLTVLSSIETGSVLVDASNDEGDGTVVRVPLEKLRDALVEYSGRDYYDASNAGDSTRPEDLLDVTDDDGDRLIVFPYGDGRVSVVLDRDGKRLATAVNAETLADALNGYVERDEAHVELGGITMTQSQYDAATFPFQHTGPTNGAYLRDLQRRVFENSRDHGFFDNAPQEEGPANDWYLGNALALIHKEVSQALEELRAGHRPDETYYLDGAGETPLPTFVEDARARGALLKPHGVPSELADVVIRALVLAEAAGIDLTAAIEEKHAYNGTRPAGHGKRY